MTYDERLDRVKMGRDLDVSIPLAAATGGEAVASGLRVMLAELVAYATAGDLMLDWSTLAVGIETVEDGVLAPLTIRARVEARRSPNGTPAL